MSQNWSLPQENRSLNKSPKIVQTWKANLNPLGVPNGSVQKPGNKAQTFQERCKHENPGLENSKGS